MANNFKLSLAARNAACDAIVDYIDTGTGAGRIEIRSGAIPSNVDDPSSGTLLATLPFSATAFGNAGAVVAGRADSAAITPDTNATGGADAGYFRVYRGAGTDTQAVFQGTCGQTSGYDMNFDEVTIVPGGTVAISLGSFTVTVPIQ